MTIKAIETHYKDYRFRSRLEARWAVFFDALGIKYEYEKEGFELPDGTRYLPDFWLPDLDCFVEIKGQKPTKEEQLKIAALTDSKRIGIIRDGTPDAIANCGYGYFMGKFMGWQVFIECGECEMVGILTQHPTEPLMAWRLKCDCDSIKWMRGQGKLSGIQDLVGFVSIDSPRLIAAYAAARQARFEHGEQPNNR